jgi:RNA polymerase sigma-70 factor (ECF subfamily)
VLKAEFDQQADIKTLYNQHSSWLNNWLRNRLGCSHQAADIAHDTYLRLLTSGRYPSNDQARPYLIQIAKGLVIDNHRRYLIEQAYLDTLAQQPEALAPAPEEIHQALQALIRIDAMLAGLKPKIRETFILSRFDGLTYSAIAKQLNISAATVRKYMLIAMQACIKVISP